jgi:hypothetical protein
MSENNPPVRNDNNRNGGPENNIDIDILINCWENKIIHFITIVLFRATVPECPEPFAPDTTTQPQKPVRKIIGDNTAAGSDIMLFGDADVGRDICIGWHICSYPGCGKRNIISEFDLDFPPICQNTGIDNHKFTPSKWKELRGGDDSCSEIS